MAPHPFSGLESPRTAGPEGSAPTGSQSRTRLTTGGFSFGWGAYAGIRGSSFGSPTFLPSAPGEVTLTEGLDGHPLRRWTPVTSVSGVGMKVLPGEGLAHPWSSALTWPSSHHDQNVSRRFRGGFEWKSRPTVPRSSWGHVARDRHRRLGQQS